MKSGDPNIAIRWWRQLQPYWPDGTVNHTADRGALARLRRDDLFAAMTEPATLALFRDLGRGHDLPEVALCAAVLASVRKDRHEHPMRTLGPPSLNQPDDGIMKPLRFRGRSRPTRSTSGSPHCAQRYASLARN